MTNINLFKHNSIKILGNINIYVDPYEIDDNYNDADIIFITHNHYDHFSIKDIVKIKNENTIIAIITSNFLSINTSLSTFTLHSGSFLYYIIFHIQ